MRSKIHAIVIAPSLIFLQQTNMSNVSGFAEKLETHKSKREEVKLETGDLIIEKIRVANWYNRLSGQELKSLCRAARLPVSGRKSELVKRLVDDETSSILASESVRWLESACRENLLRRTGRKYDLILRLLRHTKKSGKVKNQKTESVHLLTVKRRKEAMEPQSVYIKVEKQIQEIHTNRKYHSSKFGQTLHCSDTYKLMNDLLKMNCIETNLIYTRPVDAFSIAQAAFESYFNNWKYMDHSGYNRGSMEFADRTDGVMGTLEVILKAAKPRLSKSRINSMVDLLEALENTVEEWHFGRSKCFVDAIAILKPSYLTQGGAGGFH